MKTTGKREWQSYIYQQINKKISHLFSSYSMCKVLENRSQQDEERMDQLTNQLKEARMLAEDADTKSDEVSRKLAFVEDELEVAEDRVRSGEAKIMELEEELKVINAINLAMKQIIYLVCISCKS